MSYTILRKLAKIGGLNHLWRYLSLSIKYSKSPDDWLKLVIKEMNPALR